MREYQVWLPGWRELDPTIHPKTNDRMVVIAELRRHEGRARYVTVWDAGRYVGNMMFRAGQNVTLGDFE